MKILTIAPNPFFVDRGFSIRVYNQVKGLTKLGHSVLVTAYGAGRAIDCAEIVRAPDLPGYDGEALGAKLSRLYLDVLLFFVSLRTAWKFRPDVIHGHLHEGALIGILIGWLQRKPVLLDAQGGLAAELRDRGTVTNGLLLSLVRGVERFICRNSRFIVYSSPATGSALASEFGVPAAKMAQLDDVVDVSGFEAAGPLPRSEFGFSASDRVLVYVGTLHKYYGVDCLLEAAAAVKERLPAARFLICGGPEPEKYRGLAESLGVGDVVRFAGRTPYAEMPRYLALADAAVAPKLSGSEGNQKILAYMAFGLPVVCFDTAANRQMLGDFGIYVTEVGPAALAEGILASLSGPGMDAASRERMRERVRKEFSAEASAARLVDIYSGMGRR
ncbi:MAG: glycosyltransferase family 4 protein [Elusimicrobia bacterium]|nr:glycosyltransferase family 4 protein [Elusimicrobiota bacterium]